MTLYIPPLHRNDDPDSLYAFIERHAFATLVSSGAKGLHVSHIPLLPEREGGKIRLLGHVARGNAQWEALEGADHVLAIFHGPHAYVSPGWYQNHPAVPTWNYAVVHAHGRARLMDEAELHDLVVRLSNTYESGRPKPWKATELPADFMGGLLKAIVGFEIGVERLEGKFKLSQNRPAEIPRVLEGLERDGERETADLMRSHPPATKG